MKNGINSKLPINVPIYKDQEEFEGNLPKTVELLKTPDGNKVFVVGTVHFSLKSQDDVSLVIRNTKPTAVLLELCPLRQHMLELDEETLLQEASNLDASRIREIIADKGLMNGMFYVSFLRTNASLTKQLGVAPGGECRRALFESKMLQECKVVLGDRSIDITMHRALSPLSWREKLKLATVFNETSTEGLTPESLEAYKNRDNEYLSGLRDHFPTVYQSFVTERDQILAHNLLLTSKMGGNNNNVVGVVGVGHMNGICANFGKTNSKEIAKLMSKDTRPLNAGPNFVSKLLKMVNFLKYK